MIMLVALIFFVICLNQNSMAEPNENEYGIVNAWFNEKEATVENIQLKINEPAQLKIEIIPKKNCDVYLKISNPMITEAYKLESGPSEYDKYFNKDNVEVNEILSYSWVIKPTGDWINGNAPINIRVIFTEKDVQMPIEFTIADPYILNEQYSGTYIADPSSTDQPTSQGSPGFGVVGALVGIAFVVVAMRD
jgi:sarcinarray family protein